jgi:hypothetical protein
MARKHAPTVKPDRFLKEPEGLAHEGLSPAVSFQVTSEPGGWFHFLALVTDPRTGDQWVDAYGGTGRGEFHTAAHRSFRLDDIRRRANGKVITRPYNTKEQ